MEISTGECLIYKQRHIRLDSFESVCVCVCKTPADSSHYNTVYLQSAQTQRTVTD